MRRDYYIIEAKNLDNKSRVPVFIPPASGPTKFTGNHVPMPRRSLLPRHLGAQTGYNYKRSSNSCNHDIRTCKHARYNAARTCGPRTKRSSVQQRGEGEGRGGTIHSPLSGRTFALTKAKCRTYVTMQWPERVCLIISSFRDPRDGMSVMDTRLSNFSRPPSLFSRGRVERLRIEIGEIGSWYLLPSIGSDVGHFIIFRIRKWEWKRRSDVMKILKKVDENNTKGRIEEMR